MKQANNQKKLTPVSKLGEFGLIEHLTKHIRLRNKSSIKGVGDDAAVIDNSNRMTVVATDLLIEGIHFDLSYTPLKHLGYKAVMVNLSDIYAMNAQPKQITVSLALSSRFTVEALDQLYDGILTACRNYEVDLVGGDTSSSHKGLFISVTAIGEASKDELVYRNGAKPGDVICVSGELGAAYLGLQILEREKQIFLEHPDVKPELDKHQYLVGKLLRPEARRDILDILTTYNIQPTAMIDISDGLSSDLMHICKQSGVGCTLFDDNIPIHQDTLNLALEWGVSPVTCALSGGEDYELLFTVSPDKIEELEGLHGISIIGKITKASEGMYLMGKSGRKYKLEAQGWRHI